MAALVTCLAPFVAALFAGIFAWCGDYPLAVWCLFMAPAGIIIAPYLEESE